ncbi:TPA: ead/Ea22-like family protein [Salmonella enterica]
MSNIDKQALREAAERAIHDDWGYGTDIFHEQVTPSVVLALLDELEATAHSAAVDHEAACSLVEENETLKRRIAEQQRSLDHRKFLLLSADEVQRDFAEALGCAGDNESIMEAIDDLKQHIAELESKNGNLRTIAHDQNELAIKANLDSINDAVEMDGLHKRIAETDQRNAELTARIEPMDRRIAELEAREVMLPADREAESEVSGYDGTEFYRAGWNARGKADREALTAAGIKVNGE